ncbi:MAG: DUF4412 domain-containing protein [Deferribacteres bacterium]|nr:DUF4412 domain-containing protein [candidate division KSB1 bacterium]MCB9501703.1 DUF4412 domain-containing protein [Deferribacteres bacterium]
MKTVKVLIQFLFVILLTVPLFGQNFSGTIEMEMTEYDSEQLFALFPELNDAFEPARKAEDILTPTTMSLLIRAQSVGLEPQESMMKMQFADNWFRIDFPQNEIMMSMIQNLETKMMYNVQWQKELYTEINLSKVADMQKGLREHYQKPSNPLAYLDSLPPDQRAEILRQLPPETLKKLKENRGPFTEPQKPSDNTQKVIKTGRKEKISGYACEEYRIEKSDQVLSVWVTPAPQGLLKALKNMTQNFEEFGDDDAMNDIWQVAPDHMPVLTKEFDFALPGEPSLIITQMTKLQEAPIPSQVFVIPSHFKKTSMLDMLDTQ